MTRSSESVHGGQQPDLMKTMIQEMQKLFRTKLAPLQSIMDKIDVGGSQSIHYEHLGENEVDLTPRQNTPRQHEQPDDNLTNIKVVIPPFQGQTDPDAYLSRESKVEHIFYCYNYLLAERTCQQIVIDIPLDLRMNRKVLRRNVDAVRLKLRCFLRRLWSVLRLHLRPHLH